MMISIPPDLNYRNVHGLLRERTEPVQGLGATGCVAIDTYALVGLRLQIERSAAATIRIDLPSDRALADRMAASGLFRDLRFVLRGPDPTAAGAFRGVPLTRIVTATDVERFAADVLAAGRPVRPDLAVRLCAAAAEAGDNVVRHSASAGIAALEISEAQAELVVADLGLGIRTTLPRRVNSDGDAVLAAAGRDGRVSGGLADVVRRFAPVAPADIVLRSGHAGLLISGGSASHEEHGEPIPGTWVLIRVEQEN